MEALRPLPDGDVDAEVLAARHGQGDGGEVGVRQRQGARCDLAEDVVATRAVQQCLRDLLEGRQGGLAALGLGVEAGVVDGGGGGRGKRLHELLVDVGEGLGRRLVGEVEVAEDAVADADRYAEERCHRRVVRGEAGALGILVEVGDPAAGGVGDDRAEEAEPFGEGADGPVGVVVDAHGDELGQPGPGLVDHPEGAVPGVDQRHRRLGDAAQGGSEVEVGPDREDGVEQPAQAARADVRTRWLPVVARGHLTRSLPGTGEAMFLPGASSAMRHRTCAAPRRRP